MVVVSHKVGLEKTLKRLCRTASSSVSAVECLSYCVCDVRSDFLVLCLHPIFEISQSIFIFFEIDQVSSMQKFRNLSVDDHTSFVHGCHSFIIPSKALSLTLIVGVYVLEEALFLALVVQVNIYLNCKLGHVASKRFMGN